MKQNNEYKMIDLELFDKIIDLSVESFINDDYYVCLSSDVEIRKKKLEQIFLRALYITFKHGVIYVETDEQGNPAGCLSVLRWNELRENKFDYDLIFNPPEYEQGANNYIDEYIDTHLKGQNVLFILYVAVKKEHRRKGVASALINKMEELLTRNTVIISDIVGNADKESMKLSAALGADRIEFGQTALVFKQFK